jgi:hypothetical protein
VKTKGAMAFEDQIQRLLIQIFAPEWRSRPSVQHKGVRLKRALAFAVYAKGCVMRGARAGQA